MTEISSSWPPVALKEHLKSNKIKLDRAEVVENEEEDGEEEDDDDDAEEGDEDEEYEDEGEGEEDEDEDGEDSFLSS